jgi:glutamate racemase
MWYNFPRMNAIGILDSGLGGYTIFHALHHAYPDASFVFLADQANAPYGDKSHNDIRTIAIDAIAWFEMQGINDVVIACNTISAQVLPEIRRLFPNMILTGIIELTANQPEVLKAHRIAVLATTGTTRTQAYPSTIASLNSNAEVIALALPRLVPLIENLSPADEIQAYLAPIISPIEADVLVLACTHYPLVSQQLKQFTQGVLVDSIAPVVEFFAHRTLPKGPCKVFTTYNPTYLKHQIDVLFHTPREVFLTTVMHADRLGE